MTGSIFNIQRFCINDGPGIRTTVFFKGCPLNCLWCHNPESKQTCAELMFDADKCLQCGGCILACPNGCHRLEERHTLDRSACIGCGKCTQACMSGALTLAGKEVTVSEVMQQVLRDRDFYSDGGGMTLSGGEPLMQPGFSVELLRAAKLEGLHTCVETSGFGDPEHLKAMLPLVDLFLFDCKLTEPELHRRCTGVSNETIVRNLRLLNESGAAVILRCPIIPGINDTPQHFEAIARLTEELACIRAVEIEPYHPLGSSKSALLGKEYPLGHLTFPTQESVNSWLSTIAAKSRVPVRKA